MKTTIIECGNGDSCKPGAKHHFPMPGSKVEAKETVRVKQVGPELYHTLPAGQRFTVQDIDEQAHQVRVILNGYPVWLTTDDIKDLDLDELFDTEVVKITYKCTKCAHVQKANVVSPIVGPDGQLVSGFSGSVADFCEKCDGGVEQQSGEIVTEPLSESDQDLWRVQYSSPTHPPTLREQVDKWAREAPDMGEEMPEGEVLAYVVETIREICGWSVPENDIPTISED